ncbi:hypothetical protein RhiirA4_479902 [Rhizophagus irregularis]|uniref:Uncharacterized protein n=1 Tax=Rhizophagus irregularis TaxID=588596 RepID=A0A2I1HH49_9GLOM|nr:hypothetical protein RhiirA4_479902 [Rhizophagus irregularis]
MSGVLFGISKDNDSKCSLKGSLKEVLQEDLKEDLEEGSEDNSKEGSKSNSKEGLIDAKLSLNGNNKKSKVSEYGEKNAFVLYISLL